MQFSTIIPLFVVAMGVVATPVNSPVQELDARGNLFPRLEYWGVSSFYNVLRECELTTF